MKENAKPHNGKAKDCDDNSLDDSDNGIIMFPGREETCWQWSTSIEETSFEKVNDFTSKWLDEWFTKRLDSYGGTNERLRQNEKNK